jgi:hypothetical protein
MVNQASTCTHPSNGASFRRDVEGIVRELHEREMMPAFSLLRS